jgi:hypothetical protein
MNIKTIITVICSSTILFSSFIFFYFYSIFNTSNNEIIFFDVVGDDIFYDTINTNNDVHLLTRLVNFTDGKPIMIQTILDNNYEQLTHWEYVSNYNFSLHDIENHLLNTTIIKNEDSYSILYKIRKIKTPESNEIIKLNMNYIYLYNGVDYINPTCFLDLIAEASNLGKNKAAEGMCNDFTVVAFSGTNFKNIKDIVSNIEGPFDDYKDAFQNIDNFKYKNYDFCVGYSLGGAIVKYLSTLQIYCNNIITFGSLLTENYNNHIPIVEYINVSDDDGCCEKSLLGECKLNGMFLVDPVTHIIKGNHHNVKYIGKKSNNNCIGSFLYTIWKTDFNLHNLDSYYNNIDKN